MPDGRCGTPGCYLRDFHCGPCDTKNVALQRQKRHVPNGYVPEVERRRTSSAPKAKVDILATGQQHQVEKLLAAKNTATGQRKFAVRWTGMGPSQDTWEHERHVEYSLIHAFDAAPLKATWGARKNGSAGACYLVDAILETRETGGKPQSRLRWHGFPAIWDSKWIDDESIIRGSTVTPPKAPAPPATKSVDRKRPIGEETDAGVSKRGGFAGSPAARLPHPTPPLPPPAVSHGIEGVRAKLTEWRLEKYADMCDEMGYDDWAYLLDLKCTDPAELRRLAAEDLGMKPGHLEKFVTWVGVR